MEASPKKSDSNSESALSREAVELLEHIADILAEKFVNAIRKEQSEKKERSL